MTNVKNITCKDLPMDLPDVKEISPGVYDYDKYRSTLSDCHITTLKNNNKKQETAKKFLDKK